MSNICRYLSNKNYCAYWDMQIQDRETIRCEGPGGWSEDCYDADTRGAIFDPHTGKYHTEHDYAILITERRKHEISDTEHDQVRELRILDKHSIAFLLMDRDAPKGND